jgi:hypothetical protein
MKTIIFSCLSILLAAGLTTSATASTASSSTLKGVLDHYLNIQSGLAQDSMENVAANAKAIATVVRGDKTKTVPATIAKEAAALGKAADIGQARETFKSLSASLIACLKTHAAPPGIYYDYYCPTVRASWLQDDKPAMNPYLGLRAERGIWGWACPAIEKATFGSAASQPRANLHY